MMKTKVCLIRCTKYDREEVLSAVQKAFRLLGGLDKFIKKGEKVLVKPNILSPRPVEDGVCTHIEVIRAVVRLVKGCGGVVVIGDNPGGAISFRNAYEGSGVTALAKEEGVALGDSDKVRIVKGIPISSYIFECNKIISLPKMKTHNLTDLTGAVKNMYGTVAGLYKTNCHKNFPAVKKFSRVLVDVFEIVKPHLVLMDGIVAMDGDGPSVGRLRDLGFLIASEDSVAVDSVFAGLIGIKPLDILTTKEAYRRGLGEADLEKIEILGERLEENLIKDFVIPGFGIRHIVNMLGPIANLMAMAIRFGPSINGETCKMCRVCVESCPVSAIIMDNNRAILDLKKCIRCMCCSEVCPYKAVELKRNLLARVLGL